MAPSWKSLQSSRVVANKAMSIWRARLWELVLPAILDCLCLNHS